MPIKKCEHLLIDLTVTPPKIKCESEPSMILTVSQYSNRCTVPNCWVCKFFIREYRSNEITKNA